METVGAMKPLTEQERETRRALFEEWLSDKGAPYCVVAEFLLDLDARMPPTPHESNMMIEGLFDASARIELLREALAPLAAIADAYDHEGLDEARPSWREEGLDKGKLGETELFNGRGGRSLITLGHAFAARDALRKLGDK